MKRIYVFHVYSMAEKYLAIIKLLFKKYYMTTLLIKILVKLKVHGSMRAPFRFK